MNERQPKRRGFDVERRIPIALVLGFLLQTGGALFWAGSAAQRISEIERETRANENAVERVVRLETEVAAMHETLARIESKIDRMNMPGHRNIP
jgi:glucose-6-phosphate dehydrogenase assembly protein OpcA